MDQVFAKLQEEQILKLEIEVLGIALLLVLIGAVSLIVSGALRINRRFWHIEQEID